MDKPVARDSLIPCKNCKIGTLHWNPEEKLYVCNKCGIQEQALKTWISSAERRQYKKERKIENDRQWAMDLLGVKENRKKPKKSKKEKEWEKIINKVKDK